MQILPLLISEGPALPNNFLIYSFANFCGLLMFFVNSLDMFEKQFLCPVVTY